MFKERSSFLSILKFVTYGMDSFQSVQNNMYSDFGINLLHFVSLACECSKSLNNLAKSSFSQIFFLLIFLLHLFHAKTVFFQ